MIMAFHKGMGIEINKTIYDTHRFSNLEHETYIDRDKNITLVPIYIETI